MSLIGDGTILTPTCTIQPIVFGCFVEVGVEIGITGGSAVCVQLHAAKPNFGRLPCLAFRGMTGCASVCCKHGATLAVLEAEAIKLAVEGRGLVRTRENGLVSTL